MRDKHEKRCYEVNADKTTKQLGLVEPISIRHHSRSRIACDSCRRKKLKCDNATPCRTCVARNVPCTTSSASRRPGRPRHDESSSPITDEPGQFEPVQHTPAIPTVYAGVANTIEADGYANVNTGGQIQPLTSPEIYLSQDYTLQSDSFPVFNDFATVGLDFMNGLWELPPMVCILHCICLGELTDIWQTFDGSIDENSFSFFDESWLQLSGSVLDQPTDRALDMMREHFRQRSRAPSPSRVDTGQRQYSAAPNLTKYDPEIINVFLNLARNHLADSFPVFASFVAAPDVKVELCLAMAAVGALYCIVPGSTRLARSLYHDSRRLLLEAYFTNNESSSEDFWTYAMTFILLEVYGLCSGNKRSYEFTEVWHGCLLDASRMCLSVPFADQWHIRQLKDSIQTLESYRVLILGLPPSITDATAASDEEALSEIMSPASMNTPHHCPSVGGLTVLAGVVGGHSMTSQTHPWKTEFIELALDRWIRQQSQEVSYSQILLYHMTQIYLQSSLPLLQRHALVRAASRTNADLPEEVRAWVASPRYKVSKWHAENIILTVKRHAALKDAINRPTRQNGPSEPPHLPYCLYFAIVVLWYGSIASDNDGKLDRGVLEGIELLSGLRIHVAKLLTMVLRDMLPDEG